MNILTLMETFSVVVETGSFTAAAEKLGLSKSFVSQQVSTLELGWGGERFQKAFFDNSQDADIAAYVKSLVV